MSGGKKHDRNPADERSGRDAKGTGGLTFEPPSAAPRVSRDIGFAPDLSPVAASTSKAPDEIDDDASPTGHRATSIARGTPQEDRTPAHLEEDAEGRLNPVARMLSALPPRPDRQRSLLDEVQNALREQLGARPSAHFESERTFHLPSQMPQPDKAASAVSERPSRPLLSHREEDVVDAEVVETENAEGSALASSGELPIVEPWTPVSDRAESLEIAPPSDPDGTPIGTQAPPAEAPQPQRSTSKSAAFHDVTEPLTPLPKAANLGAHASGKKSTTETLLSYPAFGGADVRLSPAPPVSTAATEKTSTDASDSSALAKRNVRPSAATYPIARTAIAGLLRGDPPPDRRKKTPVSNHVPLAPYNPVTRPGKTPWRAKDIVVDDDNIDEDPAIESPVLSGGASPVVDRDDSPDEAPSLPGDGILFDDQTDKNTFDLPPRTPAPISLLDGAPVDEDQTKGASAAASAQMTETQTGKMDLPNAPRAISMPEMEAVDVPDEERLSGGREHDADAEAAAPTDETDAPDTLVNFSIGPAVMRKPAEVATPKRAQAFASAANGSNDGSQKKLETLVDTMLVGQDAETEDGEIHLQFKDDVLRGLYVSLVREGTGLVAKFVVADATVRRQIDGEAQRLVDRLAAKGMKINGYTIEVRDGGDAPDRVSAFDDDGYDGF